MFQKELFNNSLVVKEKEIVKMVDDSACKVISTVTVKITHRDMTVCSLEAIRYVSEARYNLISIRVLHEEGWWIYIQQSGVTVSQGDRVILKGEKCGQLYKLKEENSVRCRVSGINLDSNSSRVKLQKRLQWNVNRFKVLREGERVHSSTTRVGSSHDVKSVKGPRERDKN